MSAICFHYALQPDTAHCSDLRVIAGAHGSKMPTVSPPAFFHYCLLQHTRAAIIKYIAFITIFEQTLICNIN